MTDKKDEQLTKRVDFVAKDDDEQIATGIVMVPDKVDLQRDFAQPETIETFAEQFENFIEAGEADGGVMHAVWPSEHISLERNEVLEEATEIGGKTVEAGAWVQDWKFEDDELWALVDDGVLEGYSIGAVDVQWGGPYEQADLDDEITVPDSIDEDELVWELASALIREVSAVDIPAVPDAMILETKSDAEKRLGDHLGNRDGFIEEALERGHSEGEAERLWEYMNRVADLEGAGEPGKQSMLARAGKAALSVLTGSDDGTPTKTSEAPDRDLEKDADDFEADVFRVVAPEDEADQYEDSVLGIGVDFPKSDVYVDWRNEVFPDQLDEPHVSVYGSISDLEQATGNSIEQMDTLNAKAAKSLFDASAPIAKEGRTLSTANQHRLYAAIDTSLDVLQDAGVDHGMTRFTDREDTTFDLTEHTAREWSDPDNEEDDEDVDEDSAGTDGPPFESAAGGDTPDDGGSTEAADDTDMTDDTTENEPPEWAKDLQEQLDEQSKRIDEAVGDDAGGEEKDADAWDDAPEWTKELKEDVDKQGDRIDAISKQTGTDTQQIGKSETEESEKGDGFTLDPRKARGN